MTIDKKHLGKLEGKIALITGGNELFVDGGIAQV